MGCNTTKEALQPVEDNSTSASNDTQKNKTKTANNAVKTVPEIGEYVCSLLNQIGFAINFRFRPSSPEYAANLRLRTQ
jgi:hypothetical protein